MALPPVNNVLDTIGNTPCVQLQHVVPDGHARIFLKLEGLNPTGSYKDRMARSMIEEAEHRGDLRPGMTVVEATGGSTGSSLAFVCAAKGYTFRVVSSNAFSQEKLRTMSAFGSTVELINSPSGKITPDLFPSMRKRAKEISEEPGCYHTDQFNNKDAHAGYEVLGRELTKQFPSGIDGFCGAIGTAGMVMGVSKVLKSTWPDCRVAILEPASAPVMTEGRPGTHGIEGIGIGFVPSLLKDHLYDEACAFPEDDARAMCRRLAKEEGIFAGTSTGLNVVAAIALAKKLGPGKTVVTIACDTGLKYLNGGLFTSE